MNEFYRGLTYFLWPGLEWFSTAKGGKFQHIIGGSNGEHMEDSRSSTNRRHLYGAPPHIRHLLLVCYEAVALCQFVHDLGSRIRWACPTRNFWQNDGVMMMCNIRGHKSIIGRQRHNRWSVPHFIKNTGWGWWTTVWMLPLTPWSFTSSSSDWPS